MPFRRPPPVVPELSPRELEVVELVGRERLDYAAAAEALGISPHTVREYARQVRDKAAPELRPRDAVILVAHERG